MSETTTIIDIDNRGTDDDPYGFIYFSDHQVVAFGRPNGETWAVSDGSPNWPTTPSSDQLEMARQHLEQHGPRLADDTDD